MVATIPFNPYLTTTAAGAFVSDSDGGVQGTFMDDPASRNYLRGGILAQTETIPMWGGVGVFELVPTDPQTTLPSGTLGPVIGRATTLTETSATALTGFSVFNQAHNMVNSPSSPVPLSASGMMVNYFRKGSNARISVACDPSLVSLDGAAVSGNIVSWDFNSQKLIPFAASTTTTAATTSTWTAANGGQAVIITAAAVQAAAIGDTVFISGATNSGTGGNAVVNGTFTIIAFTDNQHFTISVPGTTTTIVSMAGSPVIAINGGALACKVDRVRVGNSMVVNYNPATGFATWFYAGATALITI